MIITALKMSIQASYLDNRPLMEKFREVYQKKPKVARYANFGRGFCLALGLSHLYLALRYLIPYACKDCDPWTTYYFKVFDCFLCINMFANWLCIMLYDTSVIKTKDRPFPRYSHTFPTVFGSGCGQNENSHHDQLKSRTSTEADSCVVGISCDDKHGIPENKNDTSSDKRHGLSWKHCEKCNLLTPPRAHHCDVCKKCILKRDHHCYLVGCCIGFRNQRYFVIFVFYSMLNGAVGLYLTYIYLRDLMWPTASWTDFIWPVAFYKTFLGTMSSLHCLLVVHAPLLVFVVPISFMYFSSQFTLISQGITLFEMAKEIPVKSSLSVDKHFRSVFGDFWAINFLLPGQLLFRQMEDGCTWDGIKLIKP